MGKYRDAEAPWKMIVTDFIGPFPLSKKGNRHLLVVIDLFSKFVLMQPMRIASAAATVQFLKECVFLKYGVPAVLISDNGPQYRSSTFAEFLDTFHVMHWATPNCHPQANATEAANKTIGNAIRAYIKDKKSHREWDTYLTELTCALNTAKHTATGHAPYTVLYGHDMRTAGNAHKPLDTEASPEPKTLTQIRSEVTENLKKSYDAYRLKYDRARACRQIVYAPNSIVWKINTRNG